MSNHLYVTDSFASWFCIGTTGKFGFGDIRVNEETIEPDRSNCVHKWIKDVEEQVIRRRLQ